MKTLPERKPHFVTSSGIVLQTFYNDNNTYH